MFYSEIRSEGLKEFRQKVQVAKHMTGTALYIQAESCVPP